MKKPIIITLCVLLLAAGLLCLLLFRGNGDPTAETGVQLPTLRENSESLPAGGNPSKPDGTAQTDGSDRTEPESSAVPIDWVPDQTSLPGGNGNTDASQGQTPAQPSRPASDPGTQPGSDPEQPTDTTSGDPIVPILPPDVFG